MKKLVFVFGLMLSMMSCGGNSIKPVDTKDSVAVDTVVDSTLVDTVSID